METGIYEKTQDNNRILFYVENYSQSMVCVPWAQGRHNISLIELSLRSLSISKLFHTFLFRESEELSFYDCHRASFIFESSLTCYQKELEQEITLLVIGIIINLSILDFLFGITGRIRLLLNRRTFIWI